MFQVIDTFYHEKSDFFLTPIVNNKKALLFLPHEIQKQLDYEDVSRMLTHSDSFCEGIEYHVFRDEALKKLKELLKTSDSSLKEFYNSIKFASHLVILTESGLYTMMILSRKQGAIQFRRWVTGVVLPSIREKGSYLYQEEERFSDYPKTNLTSSDVLGKMAYELGEQAAKIADNACQLTNHAVQLQENASGLVSQVNLIKAIVNEVQSNKGDIRELKQRVNILERPKSRLVCLPKAPLTRTEEHITSEQIEVLKRKVKEKGKPIAIWKKLNKHFEVNRYIFLPKNRFDEILAWLEIL